MNIAGYIDHTILKPDATEKDIERVCGEALDYGFASVCVNGYYVKKAKELLNGSKVNITCVAGFPLGSSLTQIKVSEVLGAVNDGADEIDMVINLAALKDKNYDYVKDEIKSIRKAAKGKVLKVIIETCLLSDEEKIKACELSVEAGADYVKTSTGFSMAGANVKDIRLMKATVKNRAGIKASGGIRDYETAVKMIEAGADRLGTSGSVDIVRGSKSSERY